jgi:tetratricopeptide (TPR) repeat protein
MSRTTVLILAIVGISSFTLGFITANSINKRQIAELTAKSLELQKRADASNPADTSQTKLSDEEVEEKLAAAEKDSTNIQLQKDLAFALYRYSVAGRETKWFRSIVKLLERAHTSDPKDLQVLISLANITYDLGRSENDTNYLAKARSYYEQAVKLKSNDPDLHSYLGMTYALGSPPELAKAESEITKALKLKPDHTQSLIHMVELKNLQRRTEEGNQWLSKLKQTDPTNSAIPELTRMLSVAPAGEGTK